MRTDSFSGWTTLAGKFPPTLNKADDPTRLKDGETPNAYGIDYSKDGRLKTGSCPTGTARAAPTKTIGSTAFPWYYNRIWESATTVMGYYAPNYEAELFRQGLGKIRSDYNIVTYMPAFEKDMWVVTASGSYLIRNANSPSGNFEFSKFSQEMATSTATYAMTLNGIPVVCNASGVFMWDGAKVTELTRPLRGSLGSFASVAITADYTNRYIIGTSKFVIDSETGKLFDFGTSGFLFTSRTLAQGETDGPFTISDTPIAFLVEHGSAAGGTITWQSKMEDGDWEDEDDVEVLYKEGSHTRVEVPTNRSNRTGHKFAIRLTSLSSNLYIREIQVNVANLALGSFSE